MWFLLLLYLLTPAKTVEISALPDSVQSGVQKNYSRTPALNLLAPGYSCAGIETGFDI